MKFTLEIELGNAAMEQPYDVAEALRDVADQVDEYSKREFRFETGRKIWDVNGNSVGTWRVVG